MKDMKMFANKIEIPLEMIIKLGWENNDTILRLTIEDDLLIIGKTLSHDEVIESINKTSDYNPEEYWKSFWEEKQIEIEMINSMQHKRPIHDKVIQDTLRELMDLIELLEKRVKKLEENKCQN